MRVRIQEKPSVSTTASVDKTPPQTTQKCARSGAVVILRSLDEQGQDTKILVNLRGILYIINDTHGASIYTRDNVIYTLEPMEELAKIPHIAKHFIPVTSVENEQFLICARKIVYCEPREEETLDGVMALTDVTLASSHVVCVIETIEQLAEHWK